MKTLITKFLTMILEAVVKAVAFVFLSLFSLVIVGVYCLVYGGILFLVLKILNFI